MVEQDLSPHCLAPGPEFTMASLDSQIINGLEESGGSPSGLQQKNDVFTLPSARKGLY